MRCCQIQFAIDDAAKASEIVDLLLAERLIACAQRIGPVASRYRWKGAVEEATEWLVLLKTREEHADRVCALVVAHHPYETPELVAVPITAGSADYLAWIEEETAPPSP